MDGRQLVLNAAAVWPLLCLMLFSIYKQRHSAMQRQHQSTVSPHVICRICRHALTVTVKQCLSHNVHHTLIRIKHYVYSR